MESINIVIPQLPRSVIAQMARIAGCEFKEIIGGFKFTKAGDDEEKTQDEHEDIAVG